MTQQSATATKHFRLVILVLQRANMAIKEDLVDVWMSLSIQWPSLCTTSTACAHMLWPQLTTRDPTLQISGTSLFFSLLSFSWWWDWSSEQTSIFVRIIIKSMANLEPLDIVFKQCLQAIWASQISLACSFIMRTYQLAQDSQ